MADPNKPRARVRAVGSPRAARRVHVEESARRVGHYKWIEMRLFEALGGWVATVPELDVKMRLGTHCYHHAWHAELWHKRLPELREMNPERLTHAGQRRAGRLRRRHDRARGARADHREAGRRLPGAASRTRSRRTRTTSTTRARSPTRPRSGRSSFVLQDEFEDWRDGEMLIQSLIETPDEVERAAAHQAQLEKLMLAAGGIAGPGSIGGDGPGHGRGRGARREAASCPPTSWPATSASSRSRRHRAEPSDPRPLPGEQARRGAGRLTPEPPRRARRGPGADARHLRRRDPGARGRRPHLLGLPGRRPAPTRRRSS